MYLLQPELGRVGGIRTRDLTHPKRTRYQAALQPENLNFAPFSLFNSVAISAQDIAFRDFF